jgi:hypothetical protein
LEARDGHPGHDKQHKAAVLVLGRLDPERLGPTRKNASRTTGLSMR